MNIKIIVTCDIKNYDNKNAENQKLQVIFLTEQTESKSSKPYITQEKLDICQKCIQKICKGQVIYGYGAQGFNTYELKDLSK